MPGDYEVQKVSFNLTDRQEFHKFVSNMVIMCYSHYAMVEHDRITQNTKDDISLCVSFNQLGQLDETMSLAIEKVSHQFDLSDINDYAAVVCIAMLGCVDTLDAMLRFGNFNLKNLVAVYSTLGAEFFDKYIPAMEERFPRLSRPHILESYEKTRVKFFKLQKDTRQVIFDYIQKISFESSCLELEECIQALSNAFITREIHVEALRFLTLVRNLKQNYSGNIPAASRQSVNKSFMEEAVYPLTAAETTKQYFNLLLRWRSTNNGPFKRQLFKLLVPSKEEKEKEIKLSDVVRYAFEMYENIKQSFFRIGTSLVQQHPHEKDGGMDLFLQAIKWDNIIATKLQHSEFLTTKKIDYKLYNNLFKLMVELGGMKTLQVVASHPLFLTVYLPEMVKFLNHDMTRALQKDYDNYVRSCPDRNNRKLFKGPRNIIIPTYLKKLTQIRQMFFRRLIQTIRSKFLSGIEPIKCIIPLLNINHPQLLEALSSIIKEFFSYPENATHIQDFSSALFESFRGKKLTVVQGNILTSLADFFSSKNLQAKKEGVKKTAVQLEQPANEFKAHHETYTKIKNIVEKDDLDLLIELAKVLEELKAEHRDNAFYISYRQIKSIFKPDFSLDPRQELKLGRAELEEILGNPQIQKRKESSVIKMVMGNFIKDKLKPAAVIAQSVSQPIAKMTPVSAAPNKDYLVEKEEKRISAEKAKHLANSQPQQALPKKILTEYSLNELISFLYAFKLTDHHFNDGDLSLGLCCALLGNLARLAERNSHKNLLRETLALEVPKTREERVSFAKKIGHCAYRYRNHIFFPREMLKMEKAAEGGLYLKLNPDLLRDQFKPEITNDIEYYLQKRRKLN